MTEDREPLDDSDARIAANVKLYRTKAGMSQQELADAMTYAGVPWSKRIVWAVEADDPKVRRPLRVSEAETLGIILNHESDRPVEMFLFTPYAQALTNETTNLARASDQLEQQFHVALNAADGLNDAIAQADRADSDKLTESLLQRARNNLSLWDNPLHRLVTGIQGWVSHHKIKVDHSVEKQLIEALQAYSDAMGYPADNDAEA